ncbi:unnamed protein product [Sphagnum jensenii]|uniref:Uncharacterized protein n=1 Tax=Sphagnum jensenii TaxID=128206 RepID=A0ABP0VZ96_9BRYO
MLKRNSTLKRLGIIVFGHYGSLTELAGVLRSQSLLEQLTIDISDWLACLFTTPPRLARSYGDTKRDVERAENELSALFSPNEASDNQANETLTLRLVLPMHMVDSIVTILPSNRTIRELVLVEPYGPHPFVIFSNDIVKLLQALEKNNTLRLLDLSGCSAVQERQDIYDAILNCLETKPWLHLNLQDTPLSESESRFTTIQQKLQQNAKFQEAFGNRNPQLVNSTGASEAFGNWNPQFVNSTGARVFLCGSPLAGKCGSHLP